MTLSRGMSGHWARIWLLAGCLALLSLLGGVQAAIAGPPGHAGPPSDAGSTGDADVAGAAHDGNGPASRAASERGGPNRSRGRADSSRDTTAHSQGNAGQPPGRTNPARGRSADPASGPQPYAGDGRSGTTPPGRDHDTRGGPPDDRPRSGADRPREEDEPPAEERDVAADPEPASGDDAPFAVVNQPVTASLDAPAPTISGPASAPSGDLPPAREEEPTATLPPHLQGASEGPVAETHRFEQSARETSRAADTLFTPTRDFGVPALLLAALAAYLVFHRRLDRGSLPMTGLAATYDQSPSHARFEL